MRPIDSRFLWRMWGSECSKLLMSRIGSDQYTFLVLVFAGTLRVLMWFFDLFVKEEKGAEVCAQFLSSPWPLSESVLSAAVYSLLELALGQVRHT